jgi:cation diffusion facilitator family transporter
MKKKAALLSVFSNTTLVVIKLLTGLVTGSMAVISEALHSGTDLVASLMAFLSVREAEKPADTKHPYGHGKFENLSGLFEALLIVAAAVFIFYESIARILRGAEIKMPLLAIIVMGVSAITNFFVSRYLFRVAKKTDSIALEADAKHLSADFYSSMGVIGGLLLVSVSGLHLFDSLTAILVAGIILYEGILLTKTSTEGLLDKSLPEEELTEIKEILDSYKDVIKDYHELRTRKAGSERHIDLHISVCRDESILQTHKTMDRIEEALKERFPGCKIVIHPEPCTHHSDSCPSDCYWLRLKK